VLLILILVAITVIGAIGFWILLVPAVPPFFAVVGLWWAVDRVTRGGRERARIGKELKRIDVGARLEGGGSREVLIVLADPHVTGSCSETIAWRGQTREARKLLSAIPAWSGAEGFLASFSIRPDTQLASELDRLGVSEARAQAREIASWVGATYDPLGADHIPGVVVVLEGEGESAWEHVADEPRLIDYRSYENLDSALEELGTLPDDTGPKAFWSAVGTMKGSRGVERRRGQQGVPLELDPGPDSSGGTVPAAPTSSGALLRAHPKLTVYGAAQAAFIVAAVVTQLWWLMVIPPVVVLVIWRSTDWLD
jgi:hypothetical protein